MDVLEYLRSLIEQQQQPQTYHRAPGQEEWVPYDQPQQPETSVSDDLMWAFKTLSEKLRGAGDSISPPGVREETPRKPITTVEDLREVARPTAQDRGGTRDYQPVYTPNRFSEDMAVPREDKARAAKEAPTNENLMEDLQAAMDSPNGVTSYVSPMGDIEISGNLNKVRQQAAERYGNKGTKGSFSGGEGSGTGKPLADIYTPELMDSIQADKVERLLTSNNPQEREMGKLLAGQLAQSREATFQEKQLRETLAQNQQAAKVQEINALSRILESAAYTDGGGPMAQAAIRRLSELLGVPEGQIAAEFERAQQQGIGTRVNPVDKSTITGGE